MSDLLQPDVLKDLTILITGASSGIGRAAAIACAKHGAGALILFARSGDKLEEVSQQITSTSKTKVITKSVDLQKSSAVYDAVRSVLSDGLRIDVLINNAGLALGAPSAFPDLKLEDIDQMLGTNLNGMMYATHAVLNTGMMERGMGVIMNVTSTTSLEVPPFPGECIYHTTKAAQEAFTNSLRAELVGTNIKVVALRPGVVADTTFHKQRVKFDKGQYDDFMAGFQPLLSDDVAEQIVWLIAQNRPGRNKDRVSVRTLDVIPTAQRILSNIDKGWNERNGIDDVKM